MLRCYGLVQGRVGCKADLAQILLGFDRGWNLLSGGDLVHFFAELVDVEQRLFPVSFLGCHTLAFVVFRLNFRNFWLFRPVGVL